MLNVFGNTLTSLWRCYSQSQAERIFASPVALLEGSQFDTVQHRPPAVKDTSATLVSWQPHNAKRHIYSYYFLVWRLLTLTTVLKTPQYGRGRRGKNQAALYSFYVQSHPSTTDGIERNVILQHKNQGRTIIHASEKVLIHPGHLQVEQVESGQLDLFL